jgi:hypothetical protein
MIPPRYLPTRWKASGTAMKRNCDIYSHFLL